MIERSFKAVLVGNCKVGKTSLLIRYKNDSFLDPNFVVYEGVSTNIKDGDVVYRMHLADTGGADESIRLRSIQYSEADVLILCFAINDSESFNNIYQKWIPEIKPYTAADTPLILVGTKSDLRDETCINPQQARKLQKECNATSYIECSAKDGSGINNVIRATLAAYKNSSKMKKKFKCIVM